MEERINNFSKITKEDIVKVSKKVSLHTISSKCYIIRMNGIFGI